MFYEEHYYPGHNYHRPKKEIPPVMSLPKDFMIFDHEKIKDIPTDLLQEMLMRINKEIEDRLSVQDFPDFSEEERGLGKIEAIRSYRTRTNLSLRQSLAAWKHQSVCW